MNTGRNWTPLRRCYNRWVWMRRPLKRGLCWSYFVKAAEQQNPASKLCVCLYLACFVISQELLCRTTLETQKLDLKAEVSNLKLKLNSFEKDILHFDFRDSEVCDGRPLFKDWFFLVFLSPSLFLTRTHLPFHAAWNLFGGGKACIIMCSKP